ncbi:MAG TPA: LysM peptidoglycan-binding domain-containing protein [Anaeromyxobacteraceae bacterium]|nr:LysM peptidoglycan-binding domain-containing protein [Anaeromyxobacteraceae bacterium]
MTRTRILALAALAQLALGGRSLAQSPPAAGEAAGAAEAAPEEAGEGESDTVVFPPEGSAPAAAAGQGAVPPPDTYTVRPGDTLWDLSGRFLNNPWYWPKVWSFNPEITNPHWIDPGQLLRFYPSAEEAPARVEPVEEAPVAEAPRELEDFSKAELAAPSELIDEDAVAVSGPYKIGYVPPQATTARHETFVTRRELEESGELVGAFEEKLMLSTTDQVYARFKGSAGVKKGEAYVIYRTERKIVHPVTNDVFGYQTVVVGAGRVTEVSDKAVKLTITQTFEPIERGALLGPWSERFVKQVTRRPNAATLKGTIIGAQQEILTQLGEHHVVFVDKGKDDGVQEGNVFKVVRAGDPYGGPLDHAKWDGHFPQEDVGDLLVIDVKDHASTALVTRSLVELYVGDRIEMRPDAAGSGGN